MLIRYSDWKKPTDEAYAFRLRAAAPTHPAIGTRVDIRQVCEAVLEAGEAERFAGKVERWTGPENAVGAQSERPYEVQQHDFLERGEVMRLDMTDIEAVLRGTVLVLRAPNGQTDYVLRDHHMLDVALYQYWSEGELPRGLFHADRHSDWCRPTYLDARRPQQAATWWALLEGFKRCGSGAPLLRERDVYFTTAQAEREAWMAGRDVGVSMLVPGALDTDALGFKDVLEQPGCLEADWVSMDMDYLQPSPQLALSGGLLREPRFQRLLAAARVRVFVLSPQFLRGGDRLADWTTRGGLHSTLRLINLMRNNERLGGLVRAAEASTSR